MELSCDDSTSDGHSYLKKKKINLCNEWNCGLFVAVASENPVLDFNKESRLEPYYTVLMIMFL